VGVLKKQVSKTSTFLRLLVSFFLTAKAAKKIREGAKNGSTLKASG